MYHPKVTIVIPAYNEEQQLPRCLKSLMKQITDHTMHEVLVVDNNSADHTVSLAKAAGATVISENKQGNVYALQTGLTKAKGDILIGTDADTEVAKTWFASAVSAFDDPAVVGVTGPVFPRTDNPFWGTLFGTLYALFLRVHFLIGKPHFTGSNFAVRKSAFEKINGLDLQYKMSADVNLSLRLKTVGKVVYEPHMRVTASPRRWAHNPWKAFVEYTSGYVHAVWLNKPPHFQQQSLT